MNELHNVKVLKDIVDFMCIYKLDHTERGFKRKIENFREHITLMTKYAEILEVWVRKVDELLRDITEDTARTIVEFGHNDLFSEDLKNDGSGRRVVLCVACISFERTREDWLEDHPMELEFMFRKLRCDGT